MISSENSKALYNTLKKIHIRMNALNLILPYTIFKSLVVFILALNLTDNNSELINNTGILKQRLGT